MVTFRDGPTGRRAGLVNGPDVWEVDMWVAGPGAEADPVSLLEQETSLSSPQLDAALRHQAAYPDEIEARIELHRRRQAAGLDGATSRWSRRSTPVLP